MRRRGGQCLVERGCTKLVSSGIWEAGVGACVDRGD